MPNQTHDPSSQVRLDSAHQSSDQNHQKNRMGIWVTLIGIVILAGTGAGFGLNYVSREMIWDRFDVVKPGVLYRSGQLTEEQLRKAIRQYDIRTVVNFQVRDESVKRESEIARELGIAFLNLPMPGDGFGEERQFRELLKYIDDPDRQPLLIHCARGTCRTGAAVAMYRFERDGWSIDDVSAEMQRQAYPDGWLSGYIYSMIKRTPNLEFRDPGEKTVPPIQLPDTGPSTVVGKSDSSHSEVLR
jgi:hypothetical protein